MTTNQLFSLVVEILFTAVFVGAIVDFQRRRDPVSRGVALTFSPFVALLALALWRAALGPPPVVLSIVSGLLFFGQPVFALHLVSLIRPVPRWVFVAAISFLMVSIIPVVAARTMGAVGALAPLIVFAIIELVTAGYLLTEARRRRGPGSIRLWIAAGSTVVLAAGLLTTGAGVLGPQVGDVAMTAALVLVLVAGFGYLVAFVPPRAVRQIWQAGSTVDYQRQLLGRSAVSVDEIWAGFARHAAELTGSAVGIVEYRQDGPATLIVADGLPAKASERREREGAVPPARGPVARAALAEVRVDSLRDDDPARRHGEAANAAFVSVVPIGEDGWGRRALVIASAHRSLFHGSDLDLLATLGSQTAIVADRRTMLAEQEALSGRLTETVEALHAASRAKSDFLASMSHELRTPLSAILGFSDLMRNERRVDDSVTVPVEWVEHVHRGGEHLLALVNDVLDLSKVEAGRMELRYESFDVGSAIAELVNGIRPLADRKDLTIVTDVGSFPLAADRGRFRQVIYNLVSNAIKFTPTGGRITIKADEEADNVRLSVTDTGVGIAPEDLPLIFDEFKQVGMAKDREGGTGLGLALAQRLLQAHGGSIGVASVVGSGTTFTILLPHRTDVATAASTPAVPVPPELPARDAADILVIEDDPSALRLLREYIEPLGYTLRAAADGERGLEMAAQQRPLAILLDVLVPRIDGWEVLRTLKADPNLRDVPVVMVTIVDEREVGLALGAVDYLVKPVQRDALLACLARLGIAATSPARPPRILAVDDEPAALRLVEGYLAGSGFELVQAASGREALEMVQEQDVDLVICDLLMPDIDGFDVVARLKADARTAPIPILICTAHDLSSSEKARLHGQILGIVSKGPSAREGLRGWLAQIRLAPGGAGA
jgi:signal transduction histidine kinase/DNA-binding response OmpR family regulator